MQGMGQEALFAPVEDVQRQPEVTTKDMVDALTRIERLEKIAINHADRIAKVEKAQSNLRYRLRKNGKADPGKKESSATVPPPTYVRVGPYFEKALKVSSVFAGDICRAGLLKSARRLNPDQKFSAWIALKSEVDTFIARNKK